MVFLGMKTVSITFNFPIRSIPTYTCFHHNCKHNGPPMHLSCFPFYKRRYRRYWEIQAYIFCLPHFLIQEQCSSMKSILLRTN